MMKTDSYSDIRIENNKTLIQGEKISVNASYDNINIVKKPTTQITINNMKTREEIEKQEFANKILKSTNVKEIIHFIDKMNNAAKTNKIKE